MEKISSSSKVDAVEGLATGWIHFTFEVTSSREIGGVALRTACHSCQLIDSANQRKLHAHAAIAANTSQVISQIGYYSAHIPRAA